MKLDGATGGIVTDAEATSVKVASSGTATTGVTLTAAKATTVAVNAAAAVTLADVNIAAATALTIAGSALTTITATSTVTALETVDASATTGGTTIGAALGNGVTYTGGTGVDTITVAATTKAITTGAGDDVVTTGAALGVGGSIDAGAGTDTLAMSAADAVTASAGTTFEAAISNFEALSIGAMAAGTTVDLANLDDISVVTSAGGAQAMVLNNMATGGTYNQTAAQTSVAINVTNALANGSDVINIGLAAAATFNAGTITVANVETVNIALDDTATTPTNFAFTGVLTAASATALNLSGDAGANLTLTGSTALANINTSGVTNGDVTMTTVADVSTVFTGGATDTTISFAGITTNTNTGTITTGAGDDTITGGAGVDTINAGAGANTIVGGGGNDVITGGAGVDTITGGAGGDTLTGGAGADIFTYTGATQSNGVNVDTITDFVTGTDKLAIDTTGTGAAAVYLGEASGYGAVLTALSGAATLNGGEAVLDTSTNTLYIDINVDGALDANDMAINLTGVTDLATADFIFS